MSPRLTLVCRRAMTFLSSRRGVSHCGITFTFKRTKTRKLEPVAPAELRPGFCHKTINIALLTELNDEEQSLEPLSANCVILRSRKTATMDAKKRRLGALLVPVPSLYLLPAGVTDPGYNCALNQQKTAQITKDWPRAKQTLFSWLSFLQHW